MDIRRYFDISEKLIEISKEVENSIKSSFHKIESIKEYNIYKVLHAFHANKVSESHFYSSTGYGYGDLGRDVIDKLYSMVFDAEDALVRPHIVSGTHAITICLFGILRPGDEIISITGKPYDTLEDVIGISNKSNIGSLKEFGISYKQVDLINGKVNYQGIKDAISSKTRLVMIQRSKGYNWRPSLGINEIQRIIDFVKKIKSDIVCFVDNCYGEFVEDKEPTSVGADIIAGSLIKNPGGGLVKSGGYIAGKKEYVEMASYRLTTPGTGKEVGSMLGTNREIIQGLFFAPHVVAESLKSAIFASKLFETLGFEVNPKWDDFRTDIIQVIKMKNEEGLISFCQGIQKGSPIDSFILPEPWDMPGYNEKVIMAAGTFVQGSSIELSADAPLVEPYYVYLQGGLLYEQAKIGILYGVQEMLNKKLLNLPE
ncbi:Cystathionine beta-lyase family protein involved in aluminum resistance [Caldanaerobius fijiensis DSM 17918]|uniref:Cystathionine beta-lyase family protein involved in aluminum resistance n=1 Tax=Caldanaerobius fijiensis DSM 17918 TaxID=1121256 RepID=A0A1M4YD13_9THEO|nr:methionine gamma-lyase family protein [Caldanaerobius fijiensis]SHF03589.1 Cystathionine beta-lyase family protein involved in aluminum resistance [Caldanaerobius fijiensis DSM 17918]